MKVWLALDPETLRVTMQDREFGDSDFPRGLRGQGWATREGEIDEEVYKEILSGNMPPEENDKIHRELWSENGKTDWPDA